MKTSEVSIKTRSTPASLSFKGQVTRHTTVKWSIFHNNQPSQYTNTGSVQIRTTDNNETIANMLRKEKKRKAYVNK